jgi:hypothetical protein
MDTRTTMRELDEVIARAQFTVERDAAAVDVLPDSGLRRRTQERVRATRAHVRHLQKLRSTVRASRCREALESVPPRASLF